MNPFEIDLASLAMINDVPGVIMSHMELTVENIPVFIMMAINIILGFMLYTNVAGVQKRDGKDPYPLFLHCVLIVWDTLCTIMMWILMFRYDFFWLWTLFGILEPIWVWGEVKSIQAHIKTDREEELGRFVKGGNITGKNVEFIRRSEEQHATSADCIVDGLVWEMKAPKSGALRRVQRMLRDAVKQSRNVIFDSRRMKGVPDKAIERELRKWAKELKSLDRLLFVCRGGTVIDIK